MPTRHVVSKQEIRSFFSDYGRLIRPYRASMAVAVIWSLALQVVGLAEPYGFKYVVDQVQKQSIQSVGELAGILAILLSALAFGGIVQVIKNWKILSLLILLVRDLPKQAVKKLLALPHSFHERENAGILLGKVIKGVHKTEEVTVTLLHEIIPLALQTTVTAIVIGWFSREALAVFLIVVVIFTITTYQFKKKMMPIRRRRHEEDGEADRYFGQAVANVATVQAFAQEERERVRIADIRDGIYARAVPEFRGYMKLDYLRNMIVSPGRVLVIGICAWPAIGGLMTIGTFVFVVALTEKVFAGCYRIGSIFDRVQESSESVHRLVEVLDTEDPITDLDNPADASILEGGVSFRGVTHVYGGKHPQDAERVTRPALAEVNLEIRAGEFVGIVGSSGGGKSTLVKLLQRVDDPTVGSVCIGGVDLRALSRRDFRRRIGYVPQEVEIFDGTIAENIAYGRPDATPEEIERAARVAYADGFIARMSNGYGTLVGNRGMRLSGGQKQRIGIARAVLMDPLIFVFDEATSHVDSISEQKIMKAIGEIRADKTTIMIAHRLSTVQSADRIVVLEEGRIVEIGSHAQLMANEGLYRRLVDLQRANDETL